MQFLGYHHCRSNLQHRSRHPSRTKKLHVASRSLPLLNLLLLNFSQVYEDDDNEDSNGPLGIRKGITANVLRR
jgi:hypothetical protein